ncbi:MAG: AAA family ATPase [Okeania sp. SIO3I5]|uniref:caspase family protein n=1 Tax=Okeania sp. SIO3I5 TaxID=2607805 RepID=UPI0013BC8416|nr:caspase family protein [Okeania sp. SIO3I5]NEQ37514.1 AAA family ATPase [Okeania sp. SIO3I5]
MSEKFKYGYALLIGVGESAIPGLSLTVTVKDTEAIYNALINPKLCAYPKNQVRLLNNQDATKENILDGLSWLQEFAKADSEATIFIYFSGHGWLDKDDYYLVPYDVKVSEENVIDPNSLLSAQSFNEALRKIEVSRLFVVIDSCHAGGMATSKNAADMHSVAPSKDLLKILATGKGRVVFSSCEPEQKSYYFKDKSQSIYTFYFLEALQGADNKQGDTGVSISNIMTHLTKNVERAVTKECQKKQTPYFEMGGNNFFVAQLRGDRYVPIPISNPFELTGDREIFGREREINRIFEVLNSGSSIAIIGESRVGKSSVLKAIAQKANQYLKKPRKPIYMDLQNIQSDDDFYAAFCEKVGIEICRGYQLQRNIKPYRILLLLDVVENMSYEWFTDKLRSQLRGLANDVDPPLRLVVAASRSLDILFPDSGDKTSPFKNICIEEYLQPWDEKTIRDFISDRLQADFLEPEYQGIKFSEDEILEIIKTSDGYPGKVRYQCYELFESKK